MVERGEGHTKTARPPFSEPEPEGPALSAIELLEVYQRALYEAITRADDDTPEWAHLLHNLGTAVVMDVERFVVAAGSEQQPAKETQ